MWQNSFTETNSGVLQTNKNGGGYSSFNKLLFYKEIQNAEYFKLKSLAHEISDFVEKGSLLVRYILCSMFGLFNEKSPFVYMKLSYISSTF